MNMASSDGSLSTLDRGPLARGLVRWAVLGAAGVIALVIALSQSMAAGAAAPMGYDANCVAINYTTCVNSTGQYVAPTTPTYVGPTTYAPAGGSYLVSSYPDPRYCGGVVNVWNEGGALIDRCSDGTRIYPVFPDYGYGYGNGLGYVAGNYVTGNVAPAYANNYACNGVYGCQNGFYNGNGNFCNVNANCNVFPSGGTNVGGVIYYNDNRFCGDGKVAFVPGRGYYCQNGGALYANGNVGANNNFYGYGGYGNGFSGYTWPNYRFLENATDTTTAPVAAPATITEPAVTTTTVTAAPVQQAAVAPVAAPAAPVAPATQVATGLNASTQTPAPAVDSSGSGVKILSVQPATTPMAAQNDGREDGK